jgi:hypothetical protein
MPIACPQLKPRFPAVLALAALVSIACAREDGSTAAPARVGNFEFERHDGGWRFVGTYVDE